MSSDGDEERHRQQVDQLVNLARAARTHASADALLRHHARDFLVDDRIEALVAATEAEPQPLAEHIRSALPAVSSDAVLRRLDQLIDTQHTALGEVALRAMELRIERERGSAAEAALAPLRYRRVERLMYLGRVEEAAQALEALGPDGDFGGHQLIVRASAKCNEAVLRARLGELEGPLEIIETVLPTLREGFAANTGTAAETLGSALIAYVNLLLRAGRTVEANQGCAEAKRVIDEIDDVARRLDLSAACAESVIEILLKVGPRREAGRRLHELRAHVIEMARNYPYRCAERAVMVLLNAAGTFVDRLGAIRQAERTLGEGLRIMRLLPPDWGEGGLDGFLLLYNAAALKARLESVRFRWDAVVAVVAEAERLRRSSAWRHHPAVAATRIATLAVLSVALFSTERIHRALRLVALAEAMQRKRGLTESRSRADVFAMRVNAALARSRVGQSARARRGLEAACQELLDDATVEVIGRESLIDTFGFLARLQWESEAWSPLFWSLCHMSCLQATGKRVGHDEAAGAEYQEAARRFAQTVGRTSLDDLSQVFRLAWQGEPA